MERSEDSRCLQMGVASSGERKKETEEEASTDYTALAAVRNPNGRKKKKLEAREEDSYHGPRASPLTLDSARGHESGSAESRQRWASSGLVAEWQTRGT